LFLGSPTRLWIASLLGLEQSSTAYCRHLYCLSRPCWPPNTYTRSQSFSKMNASNPSVCSFPCPVHGLQSYNCLYTGQGRSQRTASVLCASDYETFKSAQPVATHPRAVLHSFNLGPHRWYLLPQRPERRRGDQEIESLGHGLCSPLFCGGRN
jgi:hypothetical protein